MKINIASMALGAAVAGVGIFFLLVAMFHSVPS